MGWFITGKRNNFLVVFSQMGKKLDKALNPSIKERCASCNTRLRMTEERYRKSGNYCDKCGGSAQRMQQFKIKRVIDSR